jgi:hypothetical protein
MGKWGKLWCANNEHPHDHWVWPKKVKNRGIEIEMACDF